MLNRKFLSVKLGVGLGLISLLVVFASSCFLVMPNYERAKVQAREAALETALSHMREAIRDYTEAHGKPPHQLQDLEESGYFVSLPVDPMTNKPDWTVDFYPCNSTGPCEKLIKDVHSSSHEKSSRNNPYSEW